MLKVLLKKYLKFFDAKKFLIFNKKKLEFENFFEKI